MYKKIFSLIVGAPGFIPGLLTWHLHCTIVKRELTYDDFLTHVYVWAAVFYLAALLCQYNFFK